MPDIIYKSRYKINKMDCPSEEQLIRMKLDGISSIQRLDFDIPGRSLDVYHSEDSRVITDLIDSLNFDSSLVSSEVSGDKDFSSEKKFSDSSLLYSVLIINFSFFLIEIIFGLISKSMGLVADSLDMLADAFVYGLSIYAISGTIIIKKRIAKLSGYFQFALAILGFAEVIRRFLDTDEMPDFYMMIGISVLALAANIMSLYLLQKSRSKEAHMQASMIFTSNDIIVNGGVILAGILVSAFSSNIPDLLIGGIVFAVVTRGAFRIIGLSNS